MVRSKGIIKVGQAHRKISRSQQDRKEGEIFKNSKMKHLHSQTRSFSSSFFLLGDKEKGGERVIASSNDRG